jgi:acyl-CoA synthetase (NDP forming)
MLAANVLRRAWEAGRGTLIDAERTELLGIVGAEGGTIDGAQVAVRIAVTNTREFGPVLGIGPGGTEREIAAANGDDVDGLRVLAVLADGNDVLERFAVTPLYWRLAASARREAVPLPGPVLGRCVTVLLALAREFGASHTTAPFVLQRLEFELAHNAGGTVVGTVRGEFGPSTPRRAKRAIENIDRLLHPRSIGIVGVSASGMNFGRIILRNLMQSGYPQAQLTVIRPDAARIDGVDCVANLETLPHKLDLLIVAVGAEAVYELVDRIIATDAAHAVMLIPGGLGETERSREPAAAMAARIETAHARPGGGPVFLGANCLGVVSHPGRYDSWFIPLERLPKPQKTAERRTVLLSQSGAFMITRLSQNPWLDPRYMVAVGNQTDLTHGDVLDYFAGLAEVGTIGVYIEGFRDRDGLDFALAVRKAVVNGKQVVVYKAGRTEAGRRTAHGHTGSIAGSYALFESVLREAGAIVAEDFSAFDDLCYIATALHDKRIAGRRLGGVSGAGFEAVGMADALGSGDDALETPALAAATAARIEAILAAKKLHTLVEVRNPIDINPGADDEVHLQVTEALLEDPEIDAVVVGLDPTAPSMRALEASTLRPGYDIHEPASIVQRLPVLVAGHDKPVIGIVDGGRLYDAMAAGLMDRGVCVFRNCARGTRALARYVQARRYADTLRARGGAAAASR